MLKTISVLSYFAMLGGLFDLALTHNIFSWSPMVIALQIAAAGLMVWARLTFGWRSFHAAANPTEGGLVTVGPYRHIRHPIYASICLFTVAGVVVHASWLALGLSGMVLGGAVARLRCEEVLLAVRFSEYHDYAARTWRMIPYLF